MNLISIFTTSRWVLYGVLAVGSGTLAYWLEHTVERRGYHRAQLEYQAQVAQAQRSAREREAELQTQNDANRARAEQRRAADALALHRAGTELERLRLAIATRDRAAAPTPSPGAVPDEPGDGGLLGACAGELRDVAAEADRLATKVSALQDYVRLTGQAAEGTGR